MLVFASNTTYSVLKITFKKFKTSEDISLTVKSNSFCFKTQTSTVLLGDVYVSVIIDIYIYMNVYSLRPIK